MVADSLGIAYKDFDKVKQLCELSPDTGTSHTGMAHALKALGIEHHRNPNIGQEQRSMDLLSHTLEQGNLFIMRTMTRGEKHWVVAYSMQEHIYSIADPWLGLIQYKERGVLRIWRPRSYDGFVVTMPKQAL